MKAETSHNSALIVCKGNPSFIAPVLNVVLGLSKLYGSVKFICGDISKDSEDFLLGECKNLSIENLQLQSKGTSKILSVYHFRKKVFPIINNTQHDLLWIATGDTAVSMGNKLRSYQFVMCLLELYDAVPLYNFLLRRLSRYAHKIVTAEYNRSAILRVRWNLKHTPYVLPNKPYFKPGTANGNHNAVNGPLVQKVKDEISKGKKVILYQGIITHYRRLDTVAKAALEEDSKFVFLIVGKDYDYIDKLMEINPNIIHIPFIDAPLHLEITKLADIGIVVYDFIDLNNIYCAPNKIWEYAMFSKPMLCNDIPGLKYTVEHYRAGLCTDFNCVDSVKDTIGKIFSDYPEYSANAETFYNSVDLDSIIKNIVR
jgi:glycosyltransferase involved in cell wall biosynthesis